MNLGLKLRRLPPITVIVVNLLYVTGINAKQQQASCVNRVIPLNIIDDRAVQLTNLNAADLQARVNGKLASPLSLNSDNGPRRVVILLDASGSMSGDSDSSGKWQLALRAANTLLTTAVKDQSFALIVFTDKVEETLGFEQGRNSIASRLKQLSPGWKALPKKTKPKTALWDAISAGAGVLGPSNSGDVIYVITDGGDNASTEKLATVERKLLASGIRLFGFFFDERAIMGPDAATLEAAVGVTDDTGGSGVFALPHTAAADPYKFTNEQLFLLDRFQQRQLLKIENYYRLVVGLSQTGHKPQKLLITFSQPKDQRWHGIQLSYAHKVLPCPEVGKDEH